MCGLVGIFGDIDSKAKKAFHMMHHFDVLRGRDGAGIYLAKANGKGKLLKGTFTPDDLFCMYPKEFDVKNLISETDLHLILGHNRAATIGTIHPDNAHPFEFDQVVGAHNGTLSRGSLYNFPEYSLDKIDSEILYSGINAWSKGSSPRYNSFQVIVNEASGPMALTWYDKNRKTLNLFRNNDRDLYVAFSTDKKLFMWASEKWMIQIACGRSGIDYENPELYPADQLTSLKIKTKSGKFRIKICREEKFKKTFLPVEKTSLYTDGEMWAGWVEENKPLPRGVRHFKGNGGPQTIINQDKQTNLVSKDNKFVVFNEVISVREFEHRVHHGCSFCMSGISYADRLTIKWVDKSTPICEDCQKGQLLNWMTPAEITLLEEGKDVH